MKHNDNHEPPQIVGDKAARLSHFMSLDDIIERMRARSAAMSGFKANDQSRPHVRRAAADELSEAQVYRSKALEYAQLAKQASTPRVREHLLRMGQSCLLIAKNAEWLESTDAFLREWRDH